MFTTPGKIFCVHGVKAYGEVELYFHLFLSFAADGCGQLYPKKRPPPPVSIGWPPEPASTCERRDKSLVQSSRVKLKLEVLNCPEEVRPMAYRQYCR
jgi:hypothetical protein